MKKLDILNLIFIFLVIILLIGIGITAFSKSQTLLSDIGHFAVIISFVLIIGVKIIIWFYNKKNIIIEDNNIINNEINNDL